MLVYDYFQSYTGHFWQWEDDAGVIAIPQENTIAYRELVASLLEQLSTQGIPPFGALLLAIIATNPNGKQSLDTVYAILCDVLKTRDDVALAHAIEFLKLLSEVPAEFKQGKKRVLVLQAIFENCHNIISVKKSKNIARSFASRTFNTELLTEKKEFNLALFHKELKTISVLKAKFANVDDILAKVIALPDYTEALPDLDQPPENTGTKDLEEQLIENPKTFHVGSLLKRIWSGLNIPLHSTLPSQQPLGGVADLTNKGDLDKLLISEFANDDLVFLSRLANSEALYMHREIPPVTNSLERIILIDVSLKNWGTPKAVSFATMLAIAKHPKTNIACSAFAIGDSFRPVAIQSVDGIIEGLQFLESSLHAAKGLEAFFKEYPPNKNREIFFITEPSTLKQPAMAKAMSAYQPFISYWLFTDSVGNIDIYKKQQSSKKHIQHIQLPLEKLWQKETKSPDPPRRMDGPLANYPLLFRSPREIKTLMSSPDGHTFIVTSDRTLLRFFNNKSNPFHKGWELLLEKMPFSNGEFEIGLSSKGDYLLLMLKVETRELSLINLTSGEKKSFIFHQWKSTHRQAFIFQDQKFYHFNNKGFWAIDFSGIIDVDPSAASVPNHTIFSDRAEELKKLRTTFRPGAVTFRNVKDIFINQDDHLVFNIHELLVNSGGHLKLDISGEKIKKLAATKTAEATFTFPDGSNIEISKAGIFILTSSSANIPVIYLPAILDASLSVATANAYAGGDYYYREPQFDVTLTRTAEKRLSTVQCIKKLTGLGLKQVHALVMETPCRIANRLSQADADNLKATLESIGSKAEMQLSQPAVGNIERISVPFFYKQYITPFIQHILHYGPQDQTSS